MLRVVDTVATGAVGVWLGTVVFFSFVVAPRVFDVLERDRAGDVVNRIFPTYYVLGATLGVVGTAAGGIRVYVDGASTAVAGYVAALLVAVAVAVFSRVYLVPRIRGNDRSREDSDVDAFERYHSASVRLNTVILVSLAAALSLWHV
ncbi:MAG: hypothetical protein ACI9QA_000632 [Methanobacteriota archaeon]|jgi:hypothetical protein